MKFKAVDPSEITIVRTDWAIDGTYRTEFIYDGQTGFIIGAYAGVGDDENKLFNTYIHRHIAAQIELDPMLSRPII